MWFRKQNWFLLNIRRSLIALHVDNASSIKDEQMQQVILELGNLEELALHYCCMRDSGLIGLSERLPRLRRLHLSFAFRIADAGLQHIVHLPRLADMSLTDAQITDSGCAVIATMKTLVHLDIRSCYSVTDVGIRSIVDGLEYLVNLKFSLLYDDATVCVHIAPSLVHLRELGCVTADAALSSLMQLEKLQLTAADDVSMLPLTQSLKRLSHLELWDASSLSIDCLCALSSFATIARLHLSYAHNVNSTVIAAWAVGMKHLRMLRLWACRGFDDSCPLLLDRFEELHEFEVLDSETVTETGWCAMPKMRMLSSLNISGSDNVTDAVLGHIGKCARSLVWINVRGCRNVTNAGVDRLRAALPGVFVTRIG
jgi:hypothetical protein